MEKIQKTSKILRVIVTVLMVFTVLGLVVLVIAGVAQFAFGPQLEQWLQEGIVTFKVDDASVLTPVTFIVGVIKVGLIYWWLGSLRKLLGNYIDGVVFSEENSRLMRKIALIAMASTIIASEGNSDGSSIGFNVDFLDLVLPLFVLLLSWVMQEAHVLKEESDLTI
ncbi:MAG: DUF2975 domain-containing protein [Proteobacteria bacterium]|nr:DUF2975 domain-containing protein [Pseudomonadota bacterium]